MSVLVRRWGWGIAIIGVAVLASGTQRGSAIETVVGALLAFAGSAAWVGRRWHRIGWIVVAAGVGLIMVGWYGGTLLGAAIAPRTLALLILGPILVLAGGFARALLLARKRARDAHTAGAQDMPPFLTDEPDPRT
ncbi:MAG: hypothetical protein JSW65_08400 [Candidatus Bipolaricaulota bacterium]|nr:MAG: hypothetical protein JSW65_08400 [Candidatus Bipolaricaulota bacterium]